MVFGVLAFPGFFDVADGGPAEGFGFVVEHGF